MSRVSYSSALVLIGLVMSSPRPAAAEAGCFPPCREGYLCQPSTGECVSACNPPCAIGETCTPDARCVASAPTSAAPAMVVVTPVVAMPEPTTLARQRKVSGTVLVRVLVDETGHAAQAEVYRDTTPKVGLGEASISAVKQWEWTPATKDGVKVKTWIVVPMPFVLK